ncbi:MAG: hypothetical protein V4683_08425 [Bacteroidota bacterium]
MNQNEEYYNFFLQRISQVYSFICFLTILFGLFYWKSFNKALKIIFGYLCCRLFLIGLVGLLRWSIANFSKSHWLPIFGEKGLKHIVESDFNFINIFFYLIYVILPGWFYLKVLEKSKTVIWLKYVITIVVALQLFNFFFIEGFKSYGIVGAILSDTFLIIVSGYFLWSLSNNPPNLPLLKNSYFWIFLALFLPHLMQVLITITADNLYESNFILYCKTHIVRNFIHIVCQIFYVLAFKNSKFLKYL